MNPSRPVWGLALVALTLSSVGCRERTAAPARESAAPTAAVEPTAAEPAVPPSDPEPVSPEPETVGEGGVEVLFGLGVGGDGEIVDPVLSFAAGDPVCVSVRRVDGAAAATLEVAWFDDDGDELGRAEAPFRGSRAGLCLPQTGRLALRTYRLDLRIDGVEIDSAQFTVGDLRQRSTGGGA
jgi:hypothetical protein